MNKNLNVEKFKKNYGVLLLFFIIMTKCGFYFVEENKIITGPLNIILIILIMLLTNFSKIKIRYIRLGLLFLLYITCNFIFTGSDYITLLSVILDVVTAVLYIQIIDNDIFKDNFITVLIFISIVSLISNMIFIAIPDIIMKFPKLINSTGREGYFLVGSIVSDFRLAGAQRNQGIFWEPGAYQTFLCFAYLFELYKKNSRVWVLALFGGSILTTFSSTGILCLLFLISITISKKFKRGKGIVIICIFVITPIILVYISSYMSDFMYYSIFGKLEMVLNYNKHGDNHASSRIDSIIYPIKMLLNSPIIGSGYSGYSDLKNYVGHGMFTCTPVNWFAVYGIPMGLFILTNYIKYFSLMGKGVFEKGVIILIVLLTISTEAYELNTIIVIFMLYGTSNLKLHYKEVKNKVGSNSESY